MKAKHAGTTRPEGTSSAAGAGLATNRLATPAGRWIRLRMGILCGLLALGLGLIVSAAWDLMVRDGRYWREEAEQQRQRRLHVTPKRGTLYDRNSSVLAVSVEVPSASLDALELLNNVSAQRVPLVARDAANRIAQALSLDPAKVERKILRKRRFAWLKRRISAEEAEALRQLSSYELLGEQRIKGLVVDAEGRRYYPRRSLAGSLLGFVAPDGHGKEGLEYGLNDELRGEVELLNGLRDRSGRLLFTDGVDDERGLAGNNVYLTIDQGIQYAAERELAAAAKTFEARGGSVIVVEPATGEILALASWPSYNPNDYVESDPEARRVRGVSDVFEPGSTTKIFTIAAGLAEGAITPTQKIYCEKGVMPVDNVVIRDTHPAEWLSVTEVLAHSSNICAAKVGLSLGGQKLYEVFRRFGFGEKMGLSLPGEASGTLRPLGRPWVQVETASAAFGQGIGVTNLQLAMATAAIANGGELMEPTLIKRVTTASGEVIREALPRVRRRVISTRVARMMAELLVAVTEGEGTGVEAAVAGYRVAGKTATAEKADPKTGRYSLDRYLASFVGFVPANKPAFAIVVTLDEPMVEHAGGAVAAPVFRRVAEMALKYRGLTPVGTPVADLGELSRAPDPANAAYELWRQQKGSKPAVQEVAASGRNEQGRVRVPDLTGWPLRAALRRAFELGVEPRVQGTGLLARSQPAPGQFLDKGALLTLTFEPAS